MEQRSVHCHCWHTSPVPSWLRQAMMPLPCLLTVDNLPCYGSFNQQSFLHSGLSSLWREYLRVSAPKPLNFMNQRILLADILTTLSPTYVSGPN
jgi:glycogen synthase